MNSKPNKVLYHAHCMDGYASAWAAWTVLGGTADYQAVYHQRPIPDFPKGTTLYILDFCYSVEVLITAAKKAKQIIILDHHISAEDEVNAFLKHDTLPDNITVVFDQQHSGCVIAWEYFHPNVKTPALLEHIQDHDLWRHQLPKTEAICKALYLELPLKFPLFEKLNLSRLSKDGEVLLKQHQFNVKRLLSAQHVIEINGVKGLAVNAPGLFASDLGHALAKQSGTFGMTYIYHGKHQQYECGLRSIGDFDVATLATTLGGGGHKNASGFSLNQADFLALFKS